MSDLRRVSASGMSKTNLRATKQQTTERLTRLASMRRPLHLSSSRSRLLTASNLRPKGRESLPRPTGPTEGDSSVMTDRDPAAAGVGQRFFLDIPDATEVEEAGEDWTPRDHDEQSAGASQRRMRCDKRESVATAPPPPDETLETKCWRVSPLFRQLAGNYRSLYQIARSAATPHLLCLPPREWRDEEDISYQDVQAHLLMPEGLGLWESLKYHSLRNDGLSVEVMEVEEDAVELRVKKRPAALHANSRPDASTTEQVIPVLKWEKMEGTAVVVLWLSAPLLQGGPAKKKFHDLGASCMGAAELDLDATLLHVTARLNSNMDVTFRGFSSTKGTFAATVPCADGEENGGAALASPPKPTNLRQFRKYLASAGRKYPRVASVVRAMDEEVMIVNTTYFFPPAELSHLTPAKSSYLCEAFSQDILDIVEEKQDEPPSDDTSKTTKTNPTEQTEFLAPKTPLAGGGAADQEDEPEQEYTIGCSNPDLEDERELIEQSVHSYLVGGMHQKIFDHWAALHREQELDFKALCAEIVDLSWLEWQIPFGFRGDQSRAIAMCRTLSKHPTPLEMGQAFATCTVTILEDSPTDSSNDISSEASADLLLPLLMRVVAIAIGGVPDVVPFVTALAYVRDFGCPSMGFSNVAYACATFEAVMEFISSGAITRFDRSEEIPL
ncbi:hypothetical protein DIPPA_24955 [Diplonema papillatum]|nr:hypothetical protein DIPPA_24955 [Diplonema papillatum]